MSGKGPDDASGEDGEDHITNRALSSERLLKKGFIKHDASGTQRGNRKRGKNNRTSGEKAFKCDSGKTVEQPGKFKDEKTKDETARKKSASMAYGVQNAPKAAGEHRRIV